MGFVQELTKLDMKKQGCEKQKARIVQEKVIYVLEITYRIGYN